MKGKHVSKVIRFGPYQVDLRAGELQNNGSRVRLQEQPLRVLTILLRRPGEVVTREELRHELWSEDTFVDFDNSLNAAVNKLREALGDSAENPRFVETVPRRGYRFVAPVVADKKVRWRWAVPVAVLALLVLLVAGGLFWRARHAPKPTERNTVVLTDFMNTTGDKVLDDTLKTALAIQLEQSPFLRVLSEQRVSETLKMMTRAPNEPITPPVGREVCIRTKSQVLLTGFIAAMGSHYAIALRASDCRTGDSLASVGEEVESREHILRALSDATTALRKKLGESLASVQKFDKPLYESTTSSLEALQAFSLGARISAQGGDPLPYFKQAVQLDPNFARAWLWMGRTYANRGQGAQFGECLDKAYALRERVSERERLEIAATYHHALGDYEMALQAYTEAMQKYPNEGGAFHQAALIYTRRQEYDKAISLLREAVRLDRDAYPSYANLADIYITVGRLDEARAVLNEAWAHQLDATRLHVHAYKLAFLQGDRAGMKQQLEWAMGKPDAEDVLLGAQADEEAYYGRVASARGFARRAVESALRNDASERAATYHLAAGHNEGWAGDITLARKDVGAAFALKQEPWLQAWAAYILGCVGDITQAEKLLEASGVRSQEEYKPARALIELNRGNAKQSLELLEGLPVSPRRFDHGVAYVRGRALLSLGQGRAAAVEFQNILDHRTTLGINILHPICYVWLARARAQAGDSAAARRAYEDFFAIWKDADPDVPILRQAKDEYAKLQ